MPLLIELPEAGLKLRSKFNNQPFAEQTFLKSTSLGNFNSNGFAINDQFPSTLDGDPVVRTYDNFTIEEGHIVTPANRCKGLYLFINGDLTINGTLSMTARGANAPGKFIGIDPIGERIYFNEEDIFSQYRIPVIGKEGGLYKDIFAHGSDGINGACGAGGAGGARSHHINMIGASGTSFSGGPGGGGGVDSGFGLFEGTNPESDGGAGGAGRYVGGPTPGYGGGGAGNPGGPGNQTGQSGTGGLIILFVKGSVIFGPNGKIVSRGSNGGNARTGAAYVAYNGGGGGASGGGAVHLFSRFTDIDISKIDVSGGIGGSAYGGWTTLLPFEEQGKNGGKGSVHLYQL